MTHFPQQMAVKCLEEEMLAFSDAHNSTIWAGSGPDSAKRSGEEVAELRSV